MFHAVFSRQGLRTKAKSAYSRVTLNRFTVTFFVFSLIYCSVQGIIQSLLYSVDVEYSRLTDGILSHGGIPFQNITYLEGSSGHWILWMCNDIPNGQSPFPCFTIFNSTVDSPKNRNATQGTNPQQALHLGDLESSGNLTKQLDPHSTSQITEVTIGTTDGESLTLPEQCMQILVYPSQILRNLRREDIAWICLQFWLVTISVIAILNASVPHVLAVLMTRSISTAWSAYAVWREQFLADKFQELLADPGTPCSLDVFPAFFEKRQGYEITDLALSLTGLTLFSYLSWSLLKVYGAQSIKRVGVPGRAMHIYKFFNALLACLHMETFALVTVMGLWIDTLTNTSISKISQHTAVYQALFISIAVLSLPWISMGWYSIHREMKQVMVNFLSIGFILTSGWAIMFFSKVYRWTFLQWPFIGCFTILSLILLISSIILGVICRVNFGRGLAEYPHAKGTLASVSFSSEAFPHKIDSMQTSKYYKGDAHNYPDSPTVLSTLTMSLKADHSVSPKDEPRDHMDVVSHVLQRTGVL